MSREMKNVSRDMKPTSETSMLQSSQIKCLPMYVDKKVSNKMFANVC